MIPGSLYSIHVIEDSPADYLAFHRAVSWAIAQLGGSVEFTHYETTDSAFGALLEGVRPDLLFIDINLRGESGLAFLRRVRGDARISPFPKIILTTSTCEADVKESFHEGAAGYLVKPLDFEQLKDSVRTCLEYWFVTSRRPSPREHGETGEGSLPPRC